VNPEERPLADPGREEIAAKLMAAKLMAEGMPADEWGARNADAVGSWSFGLYRYGDPALDAWMSELERVLNSPDALDAARSRHLPPAEIAKVDAEAKAMLDAGL